MSDLTFTRSATSADVRTIQALVAAGVLRGHLLPRDGDEIRRHLQRWVVAQRGDRVVGCLSLEPTEARLWEVRSVCVAEGLRGHGIGGQLVQEALWRGAAARIPRLFAVTAAHALFDGAGFSPLPADAPEWAHVLRPVRPCYAVRIADVAALVPRPEPAARPAGPDGFHLALHAAHLQESGHHGLMALAD